MAARRRQLSAADAPVLMQNALLMGYVPVDHHLRHGGRTVSFYRGPLVPLAVPAAASAYYSGPDAASAYDPRTGLFDVSYGAAWQLGQLLALQSSGLANELYQWKRTVTRQQAIAAEEALLTAAARRGAGSRPASRWAAALGDRSPPLPGDVLAWFGNLAMLQGVPFSYLVPDERMLPPESIRFFHVDQNWIDALIDGAFSIGRAAVSARSIEARHTPGAGLARSAPAAAQEPPAAVHTTAARQARPAAASCSGRRPWPGGRTCGSSATATLARPCPSTRCASRSCPATRCCACSTVRSPPLLREPPEQLHHGVEGEAGATTPPCARSTAGLGPYPAGQQYPKGPSSGTQPCRCGPTSVLWRCRAPRRSSRPTQRHFQQKFPKGFTAAEFALELTKGVMEVEFRR